MIERHAEVTRGERRAKVARNNKVIIKRVPLGAEGVPEIDTRLCLEGVERGDGEVWSHKFDGAWRGALLAR